MYRIRGHTLLCLQGFRGEGYSPEFVRSMTRIHKNLYGDLNSPVTVIDSPDQICESCPNLFAGGCHLNGPASEEEMIAQDREVLRRLGLEKDLTYSWGEILERIRQRIVPSNLDEICGGCRWLSLGYCKEGVAKLKSKEGSS